MTFSPELARASGLWQPEVAHNPAVRLAELRASALRGLQPMLDPGTQLFCNRYGRRGEPLVRDGVSPRYTLMCLLGLNRMIRSGEPCPFDLDSIYRALLRRTGWVNNAGDLGLLLWTTAEVFPQRLGALSVSLELDRALEKYPDGRAGKTMEMAWLLTGITAAAVACRREFPDLADLAVALYRGLLENQGRSGIFGHQRRTGSLAGVVRGHVGSFADQAYPILALSRFAQAYALEEPLQAALRCASAICAAQGPDGQWWWLYNSTTGKTVRRYPVYSVHQHAMGPMALFALGEAATEDFTGPIFKGLDWISGRNEIGKDLRDRASGVVWRCVRPADSLQKYVEDARRMLRVTEEGPASSALAVLYECWPYELGWLLYAFAGRGER